MIPSGSKMQIDAKKRSDYSLLPLLKVSSFIISLMSVGSSALILLKPFNSPIVPFANSFLVLPVQYS